MVQTTERPRIFQIGFNKCGTRTLHAFFVRNRISAVHWDEGRLAARMFTNLQFGRRCMDGYDQTAFSDMQLVDNVIVLFGHKLFRELDAQYPKSFFILNTRDLDKWMTSWLSHVSANPNRGSLRARMAKALGISDQELIELRRTEWELHHAAVRQYFGERERFLEFHIERDHPTKLSAFLAPVFPTDPVHYHWAGRTEIAT
jgi:Sulfotransferase domain